MIKKIFLTENGTSCGRQLTDDQQCTLRYVSGYILQNIKEKIKLNVSKGIIETRLLLRLIIFHVKTQLDL